MAAIAAGVIATAVTGGAAAPVLVASVQMAATSAASGAVVGAISGAVKHRITTGSWKGAGKAALDGAVDGAADGFMWGGIAAGATFATAAAKGIKIQEIGRLKPSNKSGEGHPGVKYRVKKANGRYTTKSLELHAPHRNGGHTVWHWQQNTWSDHNGISSISGKAKHWTLWGENLIELIVSAEKGEAIRSFEAQAFSACRDIVNRYIPFFAQYGCTLKLGQEWENSIRKVWSLDRLPFKNGYACKIYCEVQKSEVPLTVKSNDGEADFYYVSSCWVISTIFRRGFRLKVDLIPIASSAAEDLDELLKTVQSTEPLQ